MVWLLAFIVGAVGTPGFAQTGPQKQPLSLEDAVNLGLKRSQGIQIADSQARESKTQVDSAWSLVQPSVNFEFDYTRALTPMVFQLPPGLSLGGLPFGQVNTYSAGASFVQPLYRPGAIRGIRIAQDSFRSAKDQATETRLSSVLNICVAYYDTVLADRLAEIAQAQLDQFDAELKDTRLRLQAGNASELDVSRGEVNRENVEPQRVQALNARDDALLQLKQLINLDVRAEIILTDQLNAGTFQPIADTDISELMGKYRQNRAAIHAAERTIRLRKEQIKQAWAAYLPELDFLGNIGYQGYPTDPIPIRSDWQKNWTVGFRITMPWYDGGQRWSKVQAAREEKKQADLQLDQLVLSVESEMEDWRIHLKRAEQLVASRVRASRQAERVYNLTDLAYQQGSATYLDLTDGRTNLRSARANEVQTIHDYYVAYLHLIRAVGVPPESFSKAQTLNSHRAASSVAEPSPGSAHK